MQVEKIYIGSWFQRTTLHLSELYDFLTTASSPLELRKSKLRSLRANLKIDRIEMQIDHLEYILLTTTDGLEVKLYEDGLVLLKCDAKGDVQDEIERLTTFYEKRLSPAISYVFSLGAPIPKELADIKTVYPYFVVLKKAKEKDIYNMLEEAHEVKHFEIRRKTFEIYRGDKFYFVNNLKENEGVIEMFIQEQIFIREFKGQMHRYLNLHRIIWEKIANVKEQQKIKGSNIGPFRSKVEGYSKTINLIDARINQMGAYIATRAAILKGEPEAEKFIDVLEFKHETLSDTLTYVKEIWAMTKNYVDSALSLFSDLQAKSTDSSVQNLTVVTSVGVAGTLIGLFTKDALPSLTQAGIIYFLILVAIGYTANRMMKFIAQKRHYEISDVDYDAEIS